MSSRKKKKMQRKKASRELRDYLTRIEKEHGIPRDTLLSSPNTTPTEEKKQDTSDGKLLATTRFGVDGEETLMILSTYYGKTDSTIITPGGPAALMGSLFYHIAKVSPLAIPVGYAYKLYSIEISGYQRQPLYQYSLVRRLGKSSVYETEDRQAYMARVIGTHFNVIGGSDKPPTEGGSKCGSVTDHIQCSDPGCSARAVTYFIFPITIDVRTGNVSIIMTPRCLSKACRDKIAKSITRPRIAPKCRTCYIPAVSTITCPKCQAAYYCSIICISKDRENHNDYCEALQVHRKKV